MAGLAVLPSTSALPLPFPGCSRRAGSLRRIAPKVGRSGPLTIVAQLELKPPPYSLNALEPYMSQETLEFHWGKHHRGYVDGLNRQILGTELAGLSLEEIVIKSYNEGDLLPTFNNAAQIWNHDFFWQSMKPDGGGKPFGVLMELIERDFGSFEGMMAQFKNAALTQFGSGWAWLVYKANRLDVGNAVNPCPTEKDYKLIIEKTPNAVNPLIWDYNPILVVDVWEHAYYLDYQNRRPDFVSTFMDKLISWEAASARLEAAMAQAAEAQAAERAREEEERRKEEEEDEETRDDGGDMKMYVDSDDDGLEDE
uniref:superoxide dismutase n=1 Tax=Zantedeschia aethiopica TaxID=69721 RepID=O82583_ZANAE|nr:iron superoxide dismutase [Zantedeschia aethiopica]